MRQGPWTGRYPAAAAMVIFALVPYLALSAALQPITPIIAKDLHMSLQAMSLTSGMANAGYAVGTVLAVLLAQHLPQRRMLVLYAALLVLGSVLAAAAPDAGFFIAGHVLQGLCTSLLLIAAVPPLVVSFSHLEAALDGDDPQCLHLRSSRPGAAGGRHPGASQRVASIVLDHRRHRRGGAGAVAADLSGRPAG